MAQRQDCILERDAHSPMLVGLQESLSKTLAGRVTPVKWLYRTATSEVFLARDCQADAGDSQFDGFVRLHVLRSDIDDSARVGLFYFEAQAASALSHPNITGVVDSAVAGSTWYYSIKYNPQFETLRQILDRTGWLEIDKAIRIISDIAVGLRHAHDRNVMHLNLTPENILVGPAGDAIVTEFGLNLDCDIPEAARIRSSQMPVEYMSPEQNSGGQLDKRTDLYSAGVILFEMLTDRTPFAAGAPELVRSRQASTDACSARLFRFEVPDQLASVAAHLLERDPKKRVQAASDLISELDDLIVQRDLVDALELALADDRIGNNECSHPEPNQAVPGDWGLNNEAETDALVIHVDDEPEDLAPAVDEAIGSDLESRVLVEPRAMQPESNAVVEQPPPVSAGGASQTVTGEPAPAINSAVAADERRDEVITKPATIEPSRPFGSRVTWFGRETTHETTGCWNETADSIPLKPVPAFLSNVSESWPRRRTSRVLLFMIIVAVGTVFFLPANQSREDQSETSVQPQSMGGERRSEATNPATSPQSQTGPSPTGYGRDVATASSPTTSNLGSATPQSGNKSAFQRPKGRSRRSISLSRRSTITHNNSGGRQVRWFRRED